MSHFRDSYLPKNAQFRSDYAMIHGKGLHNQHSQNRFSVAGDDQRSITNRTRKGAQSIVGKDLDETSFGGGATEPSSGNRTIEQVTLQPWNVKEWEKMTKQEEYELEFMRLNQQKKEVLRQEQAKKAQQRLVTPTISPFIIINRRKRDYSRESRTVWRGLRSWVRWRCRRQSSR